MTLQTDCLGKTPVSGQTVQAYYDESHTSPVATLRTRIKLLCLSHERLRMDFEGLEIVHEETTNEVKSVLLLLDGLAEQWGDEAIFRRCRDRLRKLVGDSQ